MKKEKKKKPVERLNFFRKAFGKVVVELGGTSIGSVICFRRVLQT